MQDLTMADGATGMRGGTQLPAPVALAASFPRAGAGQLGDLLGSETRDMGCGSTGEGEGCWECAPAMPRSGLE